MPQSTVPSQSTISSFFQSSPPKKKSGKRAASPIDLTSDNELNKSTPKRPRISQSASGSVANNKHSVSSVHDDWRFSPDKSKASPAKPRTAEQNARHEAFKKRLLQDNSWFLREESYKPEPQDQSVHEGGSTAPDDHDSGDESDRFEKLRELFSNKNKAKGKRKAKEVEEVAPPTKRSKKVVEVGPSGQPYTALEKQIVQLKKENTGTLLMVEVGYKYKFFGDDAKVATKELGMVSYMDRNFLVASIPVETMHKRLKTLLQCGYRVGIVNQTETAALKKVSDNRNTLFERKLTNLFTATTYIEALDSVDDTGEAAVPPFMCLIEETKGKNSADVSIGMIMICPSTGDVTYDDFDDNTRLVHARPSELLFPQNNISEATKKMLSHFAGLTSGGKQMRTENIQKVMDYTEAFAKVSDFYTDKGKHAIASENFKSGELMAAITDLPRRVVIALAHSIKYLSNFGIADAFLETKFFTKFTTRAHMLLAANTLINLEIFRNDTDNTTRGSLIWVLDRTKTKFGARLLRSWVSRPLVDKRVLEERIGAVQEILDSNAETLLTLRGLLKGLPDLAKGLCRIQYGQCTPKELSILLPAFQKVALAFENVDMENTGVKSSILNEIITSLPKLKGPVKDLLEAVNLKQAAEGNKETMWNDPDTYPEIIDADMAITMIETELKDELTAIRKQIKVPSLQWASVALDSHLVELKRSDKRPIPDNWILHSKTKLYVRYQVPSVQLKLQEREQRRELLEIRANEAYRSFLRDIAEKYYALLRDAVNKLAVADCLTSLAQVALMENWVRPEFTDDDILEIQDGRHPMIEQYNSNPYIPNSISMGGKDARTKIITGPNMGGKSSCVRMIALIALMAQIGSYVPAASVKMGLLDSILTRMGASDDLARGRSTFMVEMSETSEILQTATNRSLVILDELGRGTSTFDGIAIADATLQYLVEKKKSKTLFITHYPLLATKLQKKLPRDVQNVHMGYEVDQRITGVREVTFLYRLIPGLATESFGIECARLAALPENILEVAAERSAQMQGEVEQRVRKNKLIKAPYQIKQCLNGEKGDSETALEELRATLESL
ncbi:hypothetical protein D9613_003157 [Agrocybe pediades]|uniref:DNA mismatch repair protein MSH3 n=1 Tax=Agrocybe pediades TaxID=84607 RepID=A0A8H4QQH9_9AGAR|nr:hypothetical protein D9613_003157 [Agrocybe pediades]